MGHGGLGCSGSDGPRQAEPGKPCLKAKLALASAVRCELSHLRAQVLDVDPWSTDDLASMADQPALETTFGGLGMELEREHMAAHGKGLVGAERRGGEPDRARRQVKGVAVPVEDRDVVQPG